MDIEKWPISADKKVQFQFTEPDGTLVPLAYLSGYGVILYAPDGKEYKYGTGLVGFTDTQVNVIDENTFELAIPKDINTAPGYWRYRTVASWYDSDFPDNDYNEIMEDKTILYKSIL